MNKCGYILYHSFLITFGGVTDGEQILDDIYVLNLDGNEGWIKSAMKCTFVLIQQEAEYTPLYGAESTSGNTGHRASSDGIVFVGISPW